MRAAPCYLSLSLWHCFHSLQSSFGVKCLEFDPEWKAVFGFQMMPAIYIDVVLIYGRHRFHISSGIYLVLLWNFENDYSPLTLEPNDIFERKGSIS